MKIIIKTINLELSDKEKQIMENKVAKLEKFLNIKNQGEKKGMHSPVEAEVTISRETNHHLKGPVFKTAINIIAPQKNLRAEAQAETVETCFQEAKEEAEREIKKYKSKRKSIFEKSMRKIKNKLRKP